MSVYDTASVVLSDTAELVSAFDHYGAPPSSLQNQRSTARWAAATLRLIATLTILSQLLDLILDIWLSSGQLSLWQWPLHLAAILAGFALYAVTFFHRAYVAEFWKLYAFLTNLVVLGAMMAIALFNGQTVHLFVNLMLYTALSGSLILPWPPRWQACFTAVTLTCFGVVLALGPVKWPVGVYWTCGMITAAALGQLSTFLVTWFRDSVLARLTTLADKEEQLRAELAEHQRVEQELRAGEAMMRKVFDLHPDPMTIIDAQTLTFIDANQAYMRFYGLTSKQQLVGRRPGEFLPRETARRVNELLRRDGAVTNEEFEFPDGNGRLVPTLMWMSKMELGGRMCFVSTVRDISPIKEIESKLRNSEAMLRQIIETSPDCITVVRFSDGVFIQVNDAFVETLGYTREDLIGRRVPDLGMWANREQYKQFLRQLQTHGVVKNMETDLWRKDGTVVPYLTSSVALEINSDLCAVSMTAEISEIKRTEEKLRAEVAERQKVAQKLRESEAILRQILEASPDPIAIIRASDGVYTLVNEACVKQLGYTREEFIGRNAREFWSDRAQVSEFMRLLRAEGVVRNMEGEARLKDGSKVPQSLSAVLARIGSEECIVCISRDITEIKRTENELIKAREEALAASKAKSQFLSSMSHEIRTPMNAILGMADLLDETELDQQQQKFLRIMQNNGNVLLELINDILDLAKVESGRLTLEQTGFELDTLVDKVVETLGVRAHAKGLELVARVVPGTPTYLLGDSLRLRQILINLVGNAIKFTEQGEIVLTVGCDPEASETGCLHFTVADTGIGIPEDRLEEIFQSFSQADSSTTRRYGGSGLGLTIVRRLVELMHGRVWVESELGKGSTFHFTAKYVVDTSERRPESITPFEPYALDGMPTLLVDDNATNRLLLREILAPLGAQMSEAESGPVAIAKIEQAHKAGNPYRLVLFDCRMPGMDGFEVMERLSGSLLDETSVLMLTSDDLRLTEARARASGFGACLVKPVRKQELLSAIYSALRKSRGERIGIDTQKAKRRPAPVNGVHSTVRDAVPTSGKILKILLVEDSPDNRLLVEAYLKREPYQLKIAENGEIGVRRFIEDHFDLVLMDIQMPIMDGHQAMKLIRKWEARVGRPPTPIIALTASALGEDVGRCFESGATAHVAKPVKKAELISTIEQYAANKIELSSQIAAL